MPAYDLASIRNEIASVPKNKRVALYARVSTDSQTTENQLLELRAVASRHGWEVVAEYTDHAVSGAKGRDKRPQFDALSHKRHPQRHENGHSTRRKFDRVVSLAFNRCKSRFNLPC